MNESYTFDADKVEKALLYLVKALDIIVQMRPRKEDQKDIMGLIKAIVCPAQGQEDTRKSPRPTKLFTKESLEELRTKIHLPSVLCAYLDTVNVSGSYFAVCPFHEGTSPSLRFNEGSSTYSCTDCKAHGDAIIFLMTNLKISFWEAVETLTKQFDVQMQ